ncbi:MAG: hypothetical protein ACK4YP_09565 [Myxococcota bacterium]
MILALLVACTPPEEAPVEFSDAARYGLQHFDDEAPDALSPPILALEEEIYASLDMTSQTSADRALEMEVLTEEDVAGVEHPDRDPALAVPPTAVARESAFGLDDHVRIATRTDLSPMEPASPNLYARTLVDGGDCWADRGCAFLRTENRIRKENAVMNLEYDLNKDYRWVALADGREAIAARSWQKESATGESGATTFWQSFTFEIFVPRDDGTVLRMMALWSESELSPPVSEETTALFQLTGIDDIFETHDEWLTENPE